MATTAALILAGELYECRTDSPRRARNEYDIIGINICSRQHSFSSCIRARKGGKLGICESSRVGNDTDVAIVSGCILGVAFAP